MAAHGLDENDQRIDGDSEHQTADAPIRVLIVEDVAVEAELLMQHLRRGGLSCICSRVETEAELREALRTFQPTLILSDFTLPQFDGRAALQLTCELAAEVPFIFVSGTIGEERAIEALKCGAVDYVLKSSLTRLVPAIRRALEEAAARAERKRQEAQIAHLTRVLRMLSGINALVARIRDRTDLMQEACRLAVTVGRYTTAFVMLKDPGSTRLVPIGWNGVQSNLVESFRAMVTESATRDSSIVSRVLKSGAVIVCNDRTDPESTVDTSDMMMRLGLRSVVALPLTIDKTPIGVFMLAATGAVMIGDEELGMLREVAANLSFALQCLQANSTVHFLSHFDSHTGLAKRSLFCERLDRLIARDPAASSRRAIAVIDIHQLSVINDSFGRHIGDLLLQHVSDRVRAHFQDSELFAHFGGGRFALVIDMAERGAVPADILNQHLAALFGRPFEVEGRSLPLVVRSGIACYPENGADAAALVQNAEAALRVAKSRGQRLLAYSAAQHSEAVASLALEHQLRIALERQEFELHYQAKVSIESCRIEGVEALLRWRHPESGLLSPAAFLPILEASGLIVEVGTWVLEQAVRDCQYWQTLGLPTVRVAVNVSPLQLRLPDFGPDVLRLVQSCGGGTCGLDIEITEGALLDPSSSDVKRLEFLRAAGVRIAIDDFGTGYSSLSRLAQFPIDTLKIDRSFIQGLPLDRTGKTLVSTIVALARAFRMTVVAEGVEREEQFRMLRKLGCDQVQGYLHSQPVTRDEFAHLLEHGRNPWVLPPARLAKSRPRKRR